MIERIRAWFAWRMDVDMRLSRMERTLDTIVRALELEHKLAVKMDESTKKAIQKGVDDIKRELQQGGW